MCCVLCCVSVQQHVLLTGSIDCLASQQTAVQQFSCIQDGITCNCDGLSAAKSSLSCVASLGQLLLDRLASRQQCIEVTHGLALLTDAAASQLTRLRQWTVRAS